jgi:hypothetical protein
VLGALSSQAYPLLSSAQALNGETATEDYLEHVEIFWQALMKVPTLHSFIGQQGPAIPLRFDSFAGPLKRIDVLGYSLDEGDGQLPNGLEKLTLTYVEGAGSWVPPEAFASLEMLLLRNTEEHTLQELIGIIKVRGIRLWSSTPLTPPYPQSFVALGRPSPLHTLSLDLFPEGFTFLEHDFSHLTNLFEAFDPVAFPALGAIEVLSTPGTDSFALQARAMAEELPEWFPHMSDLKLFLGTGQTLLSLRYSAESLVS